MSARDAYELEFKYSGEERADKLEKIRNNLENKKADLTIISSLDDIMWTLNLRGNDVTCNPVALSYLIVLKDKSILYINKDKSEINKDIQDVVNIKDEDLTNKINISKNMLIYYVKKHKSKKVPK